MSNKHYDPFGVSNATHRSGKGMSLVSAYLPAGLAERLALTALIHQQSRSLWIVKAVDTLLQKQEQSMEDTIALLAERILVKWDAIQTSTIGDTEQQKKKILEEYLVIVRSILLRRGVLPETIEIILRKATLI